MGQGTRNGVSEGGQAGAGVKPGGFVGHGNRLVSN